jgi:HEAT repeat protein
MENTMSKTRHIAVALAAVLMLAQSSRLFAQAAEKPTEAGALAVLAKADAPLNEKEGACRQLAVIGTKAAVPVLAGMLTDEKLSHMARNALETIPDPAVDEALRDAAGKVKGKLLVGVISSIAMRRDAKAVPTLAGLLGDADPMVASAAAMALGAIGDSAAIAALDQAIGKGPAAVQIAVYDGYLRCADGLVKQGKAGEAVALYDKVRASNAARFIRMGATRGAILARGEAGLPLLIEQVKSDDAGMFAVGIRVAQELPGVGVTQALAAELPKLAAPKQILLIQALGIRGDAAALPAIVEAAKSGQTDVRVQAIKVLPQFKDASVAEMLFGMAMGADAAIADAAKTALAGLPGKPVDDLLTARFQAGDVPARRLAMDLLAQRRVANILPALLKGTEDADEQIRVASIKTLGELAGPAEVPVLTNMMLKAKAQPEAQAAESALAATCVRLGDADGCAQKLIDLEPQAAPAGKAAILRVLRSVGGEKALAAVRAASKDADATVQEAAIRVLCDWTTADVAPDLLALAKDAPKPNFKVLALRGYIRLAREKSVAPAQKLEMCKQALALAERNDEKRQVLGVLSGIATAPSLAMVVSQLDNTSLRDEAAVAVIAIAEKLGPRQPAVVANALNKVIAAAPQSGSADRAKKLLETLPKAPAGKKKK